MPPFSYVARPAKHVLRQMLAEALRLLDPISDLGTYRYVGFGGLEFVDFDLFHRQFGMAEMISIEIDSNAYDRYTANRPFAPIAVRAGSASEQLPALDWSGLNIVWLDYEQPLNDEVLSDVSYLARELSPGSVLIVTVNARTPRIGERVATLERNVGANRVPLGKDEDALAKWGFAEVQRDILYDAIRRECRNRADKASFEQLFDFQYADSVFMQTYGGILSSPSLEKTVASLSLSQLEFVRSRGDDPVRIELPILTRREVIELNRQLPRQPSDALQLEGVRAEDLARYERFYRWYRLAS
jgi:Putative O-methyltransferase